jgi:hypothetical protein
MVAAWALIATAGCTTYAPGRLLPSTLPIDDFSQIRVGPDEAHGKSCQWRISLTLYVPFRLSIPIRGNQNDLALRDALGEEYDGLLQASIDQKTTSLGFVFPIGPGGNPLNWTHASLSSHCQEIRGTPFVLLPRLRAESARNDR